MKLSSYMSRNRRESPTRAGGFSLVELAVTLGVGSIVLVVLGMLSSYALQSFLVMGNSAALDDKNRLAADEITVELRQATRVLRYDVEVDSKSLLLTNGLQGYTVRYSWDAGTRTLTCDKTDEPQAVCLRDCDTWEAAFFQNEPLASIAHPYLPATNQFGQLDPTLARIVSMSWKCSRPVPGSQAMTEGSKAVQIALRNSAQP